MSVHLEVRKDSSLPHYHLYLDGDYRGVVWAENLREESGHILLLGSDGLAVASLWGATQGPDEP